MQFKVICYRCLSSDRSAISFTFFSEQDFHFCNMNMLRVFQIFKFWFQLCLIIPSSIHFSAMEFCCKSSRRHRSYLQLLLRHHLNLIMSFIIHYCIFQKALEQNSVKFFTTLEQWFLIFHFSVTWTPFLSKTSLEWPLTFPISANILLVMTDIICKMKEFLWFS